MAQMIAVHVSIVSAQICFICGSFQKPVISSRAIFPSQREPVKPHYPTSLSETALESDAGGFTVKGTKSTKMMASSLRALLFFVVTKSP